MTRGFKKPCRLTHDWATLVASAKACAADPIPELSPHAQPTLLLLQQLIATYEDELADAISVAGSAQNSINTKRAQQVSQYHRNRVSKLERQLHEVDDALVTANPDDKSDVLAIAELKSQRKELEYQLGDHSEKIERRGHGFHLSKMRGRQG